MQLQHIYAENYKTYRRLDLDLQVKDGRSIILIGGAGGGGKTTLFEAIYGSLYGLRIRNANDFRKFVNDGLQDKDEQTIILEIKFTGYVLGQLKNYKMRRTYKLINNQPVENIRLDYDSSTYSYGTHTPKAQREADELEVNKIIKANLPSELSNYFLFDAMKTGELVKEEQINQLIKENIRSVMGFSKYQLLKEGAQKLLSEENANRLDNDQQKAEYQQLVANRAAKAAELAQVQADYDKAVLFSNENKERYEQLLNGERNDQLIKDRIKKTQDAIDSTKKKQESYADHLKDFASQLETEVFLPRIASMLEDEVKEIIEKKTEFQNSHKSWMGDKETRDIVSKIVNIVERTYLKEGVVNADMVFTTLKDEWERDSEGLDVYNFLDDTDIDMLKRLVDTRYANTFGPLDRERVALNQSVEDLPALNKRIDELRTQLIGDDYTIIKEYEKNEGNLNQLCDALKEKKGELEKIDKKIDQYDVQVTPTDDPRYDVLKKLPELFDQLSERLLAARKSSIEQRMKEYLNKNLIAYKDVISKVELGIDKGEISFKMFHIKGNEINLDQLNAASKQALMQVLLKVLYELGDYDPPVMIDTVMGVMSLDYRDALLENYFPNLASQTILLSTDVEITAEHGFPMLKDSIARVYTLHRDKVEQCTNVTEDYFGLTL